MNSGRLVFWGSIVAIAAGVASSMPSDPTAPAVAAKHVAFKPKDRQVEPPYDLASDVAARTEDARARFGRATRVAIEGDAFVVVDADHGALFGPGDALVQRVIHSFQSGPLPALLDRAVTVDLFSSHAAYVAYSKSRYGIDPRASLSRGSHPLRLLPERHPRDPRRRHVGLGNRIARA